MEPNTRRQNLKCASGDSSLAETLDGIQYQIHTQPPDVVYIKLRDHSGTSLFTSLPTGTAPILPRTAKGVKVDMTSRTFITINQVPLVLAFSRFNYGENGVGAAKAFDTMQPTTIIFLRCSHTCQDDEALYLMEPLSLDFLQYRIVVVLGVTSIAQGTNHVCKQIIVLLGAELQITFVVTIALVFNIIVRPKFSVH
ncbi:unnamed protein product [Phytophthora fragariaefolia]|uniref:Unnamed protein product n=1 Tax=Phytophthora fragariaefolia TaxID=1490495 RepID=A0A9W7CTT7_9STRA|nr:unnamed protein product [Phytophthora fragariaefolia]